MNGESFVFWVWQLFILPTMVCASWPGAAVVASIATSVATLLVANHRAQSLPSKALLWVAPVLFGCFAGWMRKLPLGGDQIRIDLVLWSIMLTPLMLIQFGSLAYICLRKGRGPDHH